MQNQDLQTQDYLWFVDNYDSISDKFKGMYVVIKNKQILGAYDSCAKAVAATSEKEALGTFIVQLCSGDESAYMARIASTNFM